HAARSAVSFDMTAGYADVTTAAEFEKLNRAIDARGAIYAKDWDGALQSLEQAKPFFELGSGEAIMNKGAYFVYTGPPDPFNPLYYPENAETEIGRAHV